MVLDDVLAAAGDEDELLDPGFPGFLDGILDDRLVDDRQHLLGHGLGGGQKAGAHAGDRKDGFANGLECHGCYERRVEASALHGILGREPSTMDGHSQGGS